MGAVKRTPVLMLTVLGLLIVLAPIVYVRAGTILCAYRAKVCLTEEMGCTRAEIASITGKWIIKAPPFAVPAYFKDEPEVEYTYFAHDGVLQ